MIFGVQVWCLEKKTYFSLSVTEKQMDLVNLLLEKMSTD